LIDYLKARKPYIVNYNKRRLNRQYMGSAHAEKACDLIVAKRQKNKGMHWSDALYGFQGSRSWGILTAL